MSKIYLAHDDTVFKNGKNGFAITCDGIFYKESLQSDTIHIPFSLLSEKSNIYRDGDIIYADDYVTASYTSYLNSTRDDLVDLFCSIKKLASFDY